MDERSRVESPLHVIAEDGLPRHAPQVVVNERGQSVESG
jgi:hypothetical protein